MASERGQIAIVAVSAASIALFPFIAWDALRTARPKRRFASSLRSR